MTPNVFNAAKAVEELEAWKSGSSNYHVGIDLFLKYGGDNGLASRVLKAKGACPANKRLLKHKIEGQIAQLKLLVAAEAIAPDNSQPETRNSQPKTVELAQVGLRKLYPNINLSEAPDEIKIMFANAIASFGKMIDVHDKELSDEMTDDERLAKLTELYEASEENKAAHAELKHFNDTGMLLGEHPKLETAKFKQSMEELFKKNPVQVQKVRDKAYNNYARHKKDLDEGNFKDKTEKEGFVNKWKSQMEICDELLKTVQ
jgi:hypothetical protein